MADIVIGEVLKVVAKCVVGPVLRGARYVFCFNQLFEDAKNAKKMLEVTQKDMHVRERDADLRCEEIMPSVKSWLGEVKDILGEVDRLEEEFERGRNKCYNISLRYSLARKMDKKADKMRELNKNSDFKQFSTPAHLPSAAAIDASKEFVRFDSIKTTLSSLLKAIEDDRNRMVGLYGMGGSGKSALARVVADEILQKKHFEKVAIVTVSQQVNEVKIQDDIAGQIRLTIPEQSRSGWLRNKLQNMRILIILDDVWKSLNLEKIGIPLNEYCHVLLITRLLRVCSDMNCRPIEMPLLTEHEAYTLFKMRANTMDNISDVFDDVGRQIAAECKGLPIAIVVVGAMLKTQSIDEWRLALFNLQHSQQFDIDEGWSINPYKCLKLSYDNLPSPTTKSLFLLCSLFPEDHEIHKEDLIRFSKGKIKKVMNTKMNIARLEILAAFNILVDSCLLMCTNNQAYVKMHDLVRDVALLIAQKQHQEVLVARAEDEDPPKLDGSETVEDKKVISLRNWKENFGANCPGLEVLLLHSEESITVNFGKIETLDATKF